MAERSIAAVLKTVDPSRGPGVRIPLPPLLTSVAPVKQVTFYQEFVTYIYIMYVLLKNFK